MEQPTQIENFKKFPTAVKDVVRNGHRLFLYCQEEALELSVLSPTIIRLRYASDGSFERDFSYAIRPNFLPEPTDIRVDDDPLELSVKTSEMVCSIDKENLKVNFYTAARVPILLDDVGFHWEPNRFLNGNYVYCSKRIQEGEYFFGLGDKPNDLNLRAKRLQNWNSDKYGFEKDTDPIYRDVPFYLGMHHGIAYGIFFDNSFRKYFDFGFEDANVASFWADGGEMNYYFIFGPELIKVVEKYAWLTGTAELPPMWALGYHQSKWSYFPESKVREIAHEFRTRHIPCDAIHIDIDYMDGFRCFTWDKSRFPDPKKLITELKADGFHAVPIIDPGIKVDKEYFVYREGLQHNYFCRRSEGELMKGDVWPGLCCFPDYTNPKVREWWGTLFKELVEQGIQGVWNDMNEPTVFGFVTFHDDVRHDYDGDNTSHRKAHNIYGMQMARASFEGMKKLLGGKRPFNLTRSGYSGVQRFSAVWTGDNVANWEHLWMANIQCQRFNISGVSFVGSDVGGFIGEPNGTLLARWIQLGIFHPLLRSHSSGDRGDKEPWVFGEKIEKIVRKYVELRYKLLPYLYTAFWQQYKNGTPIVRPLSFLDQSDSETHYRMDEFGFGDHLLLCPITDPTSEGRWMYVTKGGWYNYWDDTFYETNKEIWTEAPLDVLPLFVKAGAVLPMYPVQQYVGEKRIHHLYLHIYYINGYLESTLFEDEGEGYGYSEGKYNLLKFQVSGTPKNVNIRRVLEQAGYKPSYDSYEIHLHGLPFTPHSAEIDGVSVELKYTKRSGVFHFKCTSSFAEMEIR